MTKCHTQINIASYKSAIYFNMQINEFFVTEIINTIANELTPGVVFLQLTRGILRHQVLEAMTVVTPERQVISF